MIPSGKRDYLDYVAISLSITSDELSPETITQLVGIEPNYVRLRGAPIPGRRVSRHPDFDHNEWEFREQLDIKPGDYIGNHSERFITDFLNKIDGSAARIKEISKSHEVRVSLVYQAHEMPYIGLTREQVQGIAALGAVLDYDIMTDG